MQPVKRKHVTKKKRVSVTPAKPVDRGLIKSFYRDFDTLFTGIPPEIHEAVHNFAKTCSPADKSFVTKWFDLGHRDAAKGDRCYLKRTVASTMSVFGLACLVQYARGYALFLEESGFARGSLGEPVKVMRSQLPTQSPEHL